MWYYGEDAGRMAKTSEFIGTETVTEYTKFEFDIKYSNTESKPAKIAIVATASKYGSEIRSH